MIPRWHVLFGAIFTLIVWISMPQINKLYLALVFLSSFLIDFDHYMASVLKSRNLSLFKAFKYHKDQKEKVDKEHKKGIRRKGDFHIFHTVEFHFLIGILGLLWIGFFFIFLGMVFHSFIDLFYLMYKDRLYRREFFLSNWFADKMHVL